MRRSRFVRLLLLLIAMGLLAGGLVARAQFANEVAPSGNSQDLRQAPLKKVAPWVLAKTADGEDAEFLVIFGDQADLSAAEQLRTKEEKGRYVFETLRAKAEASQASLLGWLDERKVEHRAFYIVNAIWVKASRDVVVEIAARADVANIVGNPQLRGVRPVEVTESEKQIAALANAPEDVEAGVNAIHAPEVWALGFTGQGITIGGQDTGIEWDHPALKGHYRGWDGSGVNHDYNWHDSIHVGAKNGGGPCGTDSKVPCDDDSHGTHTVGTAIGADGAQNQIGVAPGAKFMGCRNMDRDDGTPARYIECFEFMLAPYPVGGSREQGDPSKAPDITTNSWGCPPSEGCDPTSLQAAIEAQRAAGIMTVVAAGNEGGRGCSSVATPPSFYDASYSIGAISASNGLIASFSSRGPVTIDGSNRIKPDITAPGVSVRSAVRGGGYSFLSGTSMATPHVAGAVALLWSAYPSLRGKVDLTRSILNESAVHVFTSDCGSNSASFPNTVYGYGRLDIRAAIDLAATTIGTAEFKYGVKGGNGEVVVAALPMVTWRAVSNNDWITITAGSTGTGLSVVFFNVAANTSTAARTGTITAAGRSITILQPGVAPLFVASGHALTPNGLPISSVRLTFSRVSGGGDVPDGEVLTDINGNWSQSGFEPGTTYRVTATKIRSAFSPDSQDFSAATTTLDFTSVARGISR
ncbi:MAG: S8 family serine peptidase [Blastocatellia bacterium]